MKTQKSMYYPSLRTVDVWIGRNGIVGKVNLTKDGLITTTEGEITPETKRNLTKAIEEGCQWSKWPATTKEHAELKEEFRRATRGLLYCEDDWCILLLNKNRESLVRWHLESTAPAI